MSQHSCLHAGDLVAFCESVLTASAANTSANASNFTLLPKEEWLSGFPHGKPPLVQAHIYCMFLAAPLWFATAAVTAFGRFKSWWLQIHISLALSTLVVTLSGIACVVMHIESEGSGHFRTTHHYVGITLGALLLLHVLLGAARHLVRPVVEVAIALYSTRENAFPRDLPERGDKAARDVLWLGISAAAGRRGRRF